LNAVYIQGSVGSAEEHNKILPVIEDIYRKEIERRGIVTTGLLANTAHPMSVFCKGTPVNSLAELQKKKVRVWSTDLVQTFKRLGVAAQIVPQNDMYMALQTGVIDCAVYAAILAKTVSLQEVTKSASYLFPVAAVPYLIVTSQKKWAELPEDLKRIVVDANAEMYRKTREATVDEPQARAALEKDGVKWLPDFPEADRQKFLQAAAETWLEVAKEAGGNAVDYRKRVLTTLGR
jgi:TRAP-type transport system periplasmic protein